MFETGKGFAPTEEGTPQGGVISPLLLNVALHGLEEAAGVRYYTAGADAGETEPGSPVVIRYADDLVALCHTQRAGRTGQGAACRMAGTQGSGLQRGQDAIVHLGEGFDFLGFNVRRYRAASC